MLLLSLTAARISISLPSARTSQHRKTRQLYCTLIAHIYTAYRQTQSFKRVKQEPVRISSAETVPTIRQQGATSVKTESSAPAQKATLRDGSKFPEFRTSNIDVNGTPIYDPAGKLITEIDLDADIAAETKPWRVPGTDPTGMI